MVLVKLVSARLAKRARRSPSLLCKEFYCGKEKGCEGCEESSREEGRREEEVILLAHLAVLSYSKQEAVGNGRFFYLTEPLQPIAPAKNPAFWGKEPRINLSSFVKSGILTHPQR